MLTLSVHVCIKNLPFIDSCLKRKFSLNCNSSRGQSRLELRKGENTQSVQLIACCNWQQTCLVSWKCGDFFWTSVEFAVLKAFVYIRRLRASEFWGHLHPWHSHYPLPSPDGPARINHSKESLSVNQGSCRLSLSPCHAGCLPSLPPKAFVSSVNLGLSFIDPSPWIFKKASVWVSYDLFLVSLLPNTW